MIIELPPNCTKPAIGELKLDGGVYKVLGSHYVPEDDKEYERLEVEVEDVTETEAGQALIGSVNRISHI